MPLFICDPKVDALAEELQRLTKGRTKTEVVRRALEEQLRAVRQSAPLRDRLARSKALADAMGPSDPEFDMKRFSDAMWGDDGKRDRTVCERGTTA